MNENTGAKLLSGTVVSKELDELSDEVHKLIQGKTLVSTTAIALSLVDFGIDGSIEFIQSEPDIVKHETSILLLNGTLKHMKEMTNKIELALRSH